jgi:hypothetical protein
MMTRERSNESFSELEFARLALQLALPHTLESRGTERTVAQDSGHETNIKAVVDTNEVKTLDDVTNFHSVFAFHRYIIAFSRKKDNRENSCKINNLRAPHRTHVLPVRNWCLEGQSCCQ